MTASQSRKSDHRARCLSIGHGRARSDIQPSSQIVRQFTAFYATRPLIQQPFHRPRACWSASTPFTHLIRGTQIPIAHAAPPACPSRGFLPWRFADAGPGAAPRHRHGAGIRKPSHCRMYCDVRLKFRMRTKAGLHRPLSALASLLDQLASGPRPGGVSRLTGTTTPFPIRPSNFPGDDGPQPPVASLVRATGVRPKWAA